MAVTIRRLCHRWRMSLVAALIAAVTLTGCSRSGEADLSAPSTATDQVAPVAPPEKQPGPFRLGSAPAYAAIASKDVTVYEDPRGDAAITAVFPAKLPWEAQPPS